VVCEAKRIPSLLAADTVIGPTRQINGGGVTAPAVYFVPPLCRKGRPFFHTNNAATTPGRGFVEQITLPSKIGLLGGGVVCEALSLPLHHRSDHCLSSFISRTTAGSLNSG